MAFSRTTTDEKTFIQLGDTPSSITASNFLRGDSTGANLEFRTGTQVASDIGAASASSSQNWTDTQLGNVVAITPSGGTAAIDLTGGNGSDKGNNFSVSISGSTTLAFSNPQAGQSGVVLVTTTGSASAASFSGISWVNATVPSSSDGSSAAVKDLIAYYCPDSSTTVGVYHTNFA